MAMVPRRGLVLCVVLLVFFVSVSAARGKLNYVRSLHFYFDSKVDRYLRSNVSVLEPIFILRILLFASTARNLKVAASSNGNDHHRQKDMDYKFQSTQEGTLHHDYGTEDLNAMDYSPAKRKAPIHN